MAPLNQTLSQASVLDELKEIRNSIVRLDEKITDTNDKIADTKTALQDEIHSIKADLIAFQIKTQKLEDIHNWSRKFQNTVTLAELERIREDVVILKEYKAKSTVVFAVVQFGMAALMAWVSK